MNSFEITNFSMSDEEFTLNSIVGFNTNFKFSILPLELDSHIIMCYFYEIQFWSQPTKNSLFQLECVLCSEEACKYMINNLIKDKLKVQVISDKFKLINIKLISNTFEIVYSMKKEESVNQLKLNFHNLELVLLNKVSMLENKINQLISNFNTKSPVVYDNKHSKNFMEVEAENNYPNNDGTIDINGDSEDEGPEITYLEKNTPELDSLIPNKNIYKNNLHFQILRPSFRDEKKEHININLAELDKEKLAISKNLKGEKYLNDENPNRALYYFDKAISINPKLQEAYINKADALEMLGHYKKALKSIDYALSLSYNSSSAHNVKGAILRNLDKYDEALECFNTAIRFNDLDIGYHVNKLNCLFDLERFDECIDYSIYTISKFEESSDKSKACLFRPLVEIYYERKNYAEAYELCQTALKFNPEDMELKKLEDFLFFELNAIKK